MYIFHDTYTRLFNYGISMCMHFAFNACSVHLYRPPSRRREMPTR